MVKKLTLETGKVARQADGAIIATLGETVANSNSSWSQKSCRRSRLFSIVSKLSGKILFSW